jgi:signal transduction histidine kinase/DNA-binding NarL/FixJ family response regulator
MSQIRSNVKFIIWSGFSAVIILMLILSSITVYKLNQQAKQFNTIVKINNTKVSLVHVMRDSIRLRSLSLNKMVLSNDIFFRDDEKLNFRIFANRFLRAFEEFKKFDINLKEFELTNLVQEKVNVGFPLNQRALDMLLNDDEVGEIIPVIVEALKAQEDILNILDKLIALQQSSAELAVKATEENMQEMISMLIVVVSIAILFSIVVSQSVSKIVSLKNKELERATETKSMFLANMSHEIRTPLTAIIGFAKSQMIPNLPKDHNERATKIILRNSEHLLTVINDILDFTKLEVHKLEYEYTEFSIFQLLDDVQSSLIGVIGEKSLKFNINYNYPLPEIIKTDKTRLRQILINLGGNAIKFTDEGFININIRYDRIKNELFFDIDDSGIGMSNEQQQVVFKTFNQADATTTRKYGGTGLGLTISKELVEKLGGELTVVSEIGVGSTFSFRVKNKNEFSNTELVNSPPNIVVEPNEKYIFTRDTSGNHLVEGTILLVEDIPDNQELISFHLQEMGATVTTVSNGKEALDISLSNKFDLILMDMQMPVMGGLEAVRNIRERGDQSSIIMLTANAAKEYQDESFNAGCDGFLSKPLSENDLLNVVKKYLKAIKQKNSESKTIKSKSNVKPEFIVSTLIKRDPARYGKFITKFVNHLPNYVNEISESIKIKNDTGLKEVTHKLKGVGGNMGFQILTDISAQFEVAIKQGNRDEISRLFDELKVAADKIYRGNETVDKEHTVYR